MRDAWYNARSHGFRADIVSASARIFIDGQAGSTGLEVTERLTDRDDIELVDIDNEQRKRPEARR